MARIVMKFGGTSMAGTERIRRVAQLVKRQAERGDEVAVVVSAMAARRTRCMILPNMTWWSPLANRLPQACSR
jgi:aspartokinase